MSDTHKQEIRRELLKGGLTTTPIFIKIRSRGIYIGTSADKRLREMRADGELTSKKIETSEELLWELTDKGRAKYYKNETSLKVEFSKVGQGTFFNEVRDN